MTMTNESELRIDDRGYKEDAPANQLCGCAKLEAFNWLQNIPSHSTDTDLVEVRFKNTRKGYFRNQNQLRLKLGDIIAVEASPGHDIGIVSLTGELVVRQVLKNNLSPDSDDLKKIYRKAKLVDIDKWKEAISLEHDTMIKSRKIAEKLNASTTTVSRVAQWLNNGQGGYKLALNRMSSHHHNSSFEKRL